MIDIYSLWAEKAETLSVRVKAIARGNEDFYQEGILGLRDGLLRDPRATDSYLLQAAKFAMNNYKNRGKSVDNGSKHPVTKTLLDGTVKTYKKDMVPIYIDNLVSGFRSEFPDHSYPPDILALDTICAEKFYGLLDKDEAKLVGTCIQTLDGRSHDYKARRELGMDNVKYSTVKRSAYRKFIIAFGTDEQIDTLDERDAYEYQGSYERM